MQRSAIRTQIYDRSNDNGAIVSVTNMNTWIDLAVRAVWYAYAWPFKSKSVTSLVTTAGSKDLALPADVQEIKQLINTSNNLHIAPRNERFLQLLYPDDTVTSFPLFYCDGGNVSPTNLTGPPVRHLHLYPVPQANYNLFLRYQALPALPSQQSVPDSAFTPFPEDFDEAVIQWVLTRFYRKVGDVAQANLAQQAYAVELQRMIAIYSTMTEAFPMIDSELDTNFGNFMGGWGYS